MVKEPGPETVLVQSPMRWFGSALGVLLALLSVVGIEFDDDGWRRFVLLPFAAVLFSVVALRTYRSGVSCSASGVFSVQEFRTHRYKWADIDRFEQRGLRGIGIVLTTGRWVSVVSYATLGDVSPEAATARLEEARRRFQGLERQA